MAQASKRTKRERKVKRELSLQKRVFSQYLNIQSYQQQVAQLQAIVRYTKVMLCAILGQQGGSMEVTQGTYEQAMQNIEKLAYRVKPKKDDEKTMIVFLVEETPPGLEPGEPVHAQPASAGKVEIRHVFDDEGDHGSDENQGRQSDDPSPETAS